MQYNVLQIVGQISHFPSFPSKYIEKYGIYEAPVPLFPPYINVPEKVDFIVGLRAIQQYFGQTTLEKNYNIVLFLHNNRFISMVCAQIMKLSQE